MVVKPLFVLEIRHKLMIKKGLKPSKIILIGNIMFNNNNYYYYFLFSVFKLKYMPTVYNMSLILVICLIFISFNVKSHRAFVCFGGYMYIE